VIIILGEAILEGELMLVSFVRIPMETLNSNDHTAGATGTGKTKTLQILAEQISVKGLPSLLMDINVDFDMYVQMFLVLSINWSCY
tara:strand:+ start:1566 stop:1823 length:258 start_codon:yes stop_codon:yes gene_type:complete